MALTPVEIRHVRLGRRPLGYDRRATDRLLHEIAESFEHVWRERADLHDHVERLEAELGRSRELEALLRNTLVSAERAPDEVRAQGRREASWRSAPCGRSKPKPGLLPAPFSRARSSGWTPKPSRRRSRNRPPDAFTTPAGRRLYSEEGNVETVGAPSASGLTHSQAEGA